MGRHVDADADAAGRRVLRLDGELVLLGVMLYGLGAFCGVLSRLTAGMPPVAAWTWVAGGVTVWALACAPDYPGHDRG